MAKPTVQEIATGPWVSRGLVEPVGRPQPLAYWLLETSGQAREVEPIFGWDPYHRIIQTYDEWGDPAYYLVP